ncbi:MAG: ribonuclease Z [Bacteroidales bacterium]|nr:ribonuclease Z [Bacteroidales bacterium]
MNNFTLRIMGTASAMPVIERFQSAQVLEVPGRLFLIDCGEGVQRQLLKNKVSLAKLDTIFISHIHGDHLFGLFPLLSTLGLQSKTAPIVIYGPSNLGPLLKFFMSYYGKGVGIEVDFHPLSMKAPEVIYSTRSLEVIAFPLNHKIETYGYMFREKMPQFNVRKEMVDRYSLTLTEIGALKRGEDVVRPAGPDEGATFMNGFIRHSGTDEPLVIRNSEAAYLPYEPRSYAYCSDTAPFPELPEWVEGVDLLYHEATYLAEREDQAHLRYHSTTLQAAECALRAGAGKLVIGHYSSRCRDAALYQAECRTVFPETYAAGDGDIFEI